MVSVQWIEHMKHMRKRNKIIEADRKPVMSKSWSLVLEKGGIQNTNSCSPGPQHILEYQRHGYQCNCG